jgi:hypothetical protein
MIICLLTLFVYWICEYLVMYSNVFSSFLLFILLLYLFYLIVHFLSVYYQLFILVSYIFLPLEKQGWSPA